MSPQPDTNSSTSYPKHKCTFVIKDGVTDICTVPACNQMRMTELVTVNHPSHYTTGSIEVIDAIEDWDLGFNLGNAVKYIARAGKKDPTKTTEDLEKAAWYLRRHINAIRTSKQPSDSETP